MRFDVLNRDLNVFAPHFLEASAGTGKTFAIEHLVCRFLIEGEASLSIEQILVVTFTRAAARELKLRIRRNLFRIKEELSSGSASIDYLKAICEKGKAAVKSAIEKIEAALICFDTAQIFTLHGFCHRILNEFAFEAGVGLEVSDPDEKEHVAFLEQIVKDHLKEGVARPDYSPAQIKAVLGKYKREPKRLISSLVELVISGKEISASLGHAELLAAFLEEVRSLPALDVSLLKADFDLLAPLYKKMTGDEVPSQINALCTILASKNCTPDQFDRLLKQDFFLEKMGADNIKVRAKFPEASSLHYPGLIDNLRRSLLPFIDMAKDSFRTFLRLARDIQKKSQPLLDSKEKFSPDTLLLKVEKALQMPRFIEKVRQKYRAAVIDEFQDTDPVQWNIFERLFLAHIDAICLVGDPKQSIYAFRNADVYTYLSAAKAMGGSAKKHLDTNYRSTGPLVDALNLLFSKAEGRWIGLPRGHERLEVLPVKAGAKLATSDIEAPIHFFISIDKKGKSKKFPTSEMLEKKAFPFIASEIAKLHGNGLEYHDIAVLIKDRYQAQAVVDYLKKCGIPASSKKGASLIDSPAYSALKEMLSAVCFPYDMGKVKAALGGPLIAWKDAQLNKGLEEPELLEAKAKMQSLHHLLFQRGFGPFFQTFLNLTWSASQPLLQEVLRRGDLSLYLDLRKLSELIIEEEMASGLKGEAFLTFLEEIAAEAHRDENRLKAPPQEEKGSVTVMTIHMSKGLEFDTVFALGLSSRHKIFEQMTVKQNDRSIITVFDQTDPACVRAIEELDAEKMRQLYVALTRAKTRLYVPLMLEEEQKDIEYGEAAPSELFFAKVAMPEASHRELYSIIPKLDIHGIHGILESMKPYIQSRILEEVLPPIVEKTQSAPSTLCPPSALNLPACDEQVYSFTSLSKKESHLEIIRPASDALLSPHTLPLGSSTGHLLHLLFEKIFKRGLHHPLDEEALSKLIGDAIAFSPLERFQPILLPWIVGLLKKPLVDASPFALCDVLRENLQQELEFFFPVSRGMMKGFADLFFEYGGKYYLLDWKSNYLGPSDVDYTSEKIVTVMRQNDYYLQASIYAGALKRFVKLFDNRCFSECFGGAIYYFIRGEAVYHFVPEPFEDLSHEPI